MHMICTNACKNAMDACTCVFITRLSMLCFNYTHTICFMLLAHMVHVNACMIAMNACAPQYSNHSTRMLNQSPNSAHMTRNIANDAH